MTLPTREGTQLTIYNSEDITMVREHRLLTVKEGVNRIQFSWANTLIDPTSIEFRILDQQDKVDLVDTTFPAGRNDALQWNIKSQIAGKIPVEIRYFTSGITWAADYVGIANEDETKLDVTGYVRVTNSSGEHYDNAQTRLVVGKINLVEKIADLARRPPPGDGRELPTASRMIVARAMPYRESAKDGDEGARWKWRRSWTTNEAGRPKQVVKQGLSEYFLFTIEGREDIKDKEPKRLVALKVADVPLESIYKLTDRTGDQGSSPSSTASRTSSCWTTRAKRRSSRRWRISASRRCPTARSGSSPSTRARTWPTSAARRPSTCPSATAWKSTSGRTRTSRSIAALKDQKIGNVVARQYKRRLDDQFVLYYDLIDYDETFFYEEELVSGKPVPAKIEVERQFDANVVLWGSEGEAQGLDEQRAGGLRRSAHGRRPRGTGRPAARQVFSGPAAGEEADGRVQRDLQAAEGRAGVERGEEAGAAVATGDPSSNCFTPTM